MEVVRSNYTDVQTMAAWERLYRSEGLMNANWFLHPDWHRLWWEHYGKPLTHASLLLLLVKQGNKTIAVAPLVAYERRFLRREMWRTVRFSGYPLTPHADILVSASHAVEVWHSIIEYIDAQFENSWIELDDITQQHTLKHVSLHKYNIIDTHGESYLRIAIPDVRSDTETPSHGLTKSLKLWNADARYQWEFVAGFDEEITRTMIQYNKDTFGGNSYFVLPQNESFYWDLCATASGDIWYAVISHGKPVSILMGFRFGSVLYHFMSGTTRTHEMPNMRPGTMNTYRLLEYMRGQNFSALDLLRGREAYKYHFGPAEDHADKISLVPVHSLSRYRTAHMLQRIKKGIRA